MMERLVRRRDARGQFSFATQAKAVVPQREEFVLAKSHKGLHLLARSEDALVLPLRALRAAFGPALQVDAPQRGEPVMEVRIGLERRHLSRVRHALGRRGVNASEEYVGAHYCVLRFEAPLEALLGLPVELAEFTSGRATDQILLSGYR
jgi:translation elongation factor EF-G